MGGLLEADVVEAEAGINPGVSALSWAYAVFVEYAAGPSMYDYSAFPRFAQLLEAAWETAADPQLVWGSGTSPDSPSKRRFLRDIEDLLCELDDAGWMGFLRRANIFAQRDAVRGWQQATDALNELVAYAALKHRYGASPAFVPTRKKVRRPDLELAHSGGLVLCESKTINISGGEAEARSTGSARGIEASIGLGYFRKIGTAIETARRQLDGYRAGEHPTKIVFLTFNFDDMLHEYVGVYRQQIEEYLEGYPLRDLEIMKHSLDAFYAASA